MGLRTLEEFRFRLNRTLKPAQEGNELLDQWINEAIAEIQVILDLPSRYATTTVSTVVDQIPYTLNTSLIGLVAVRDTTNDRLLLKLGYTNFFQRDPASTGQPTHYSRLDRDLVVWPTPDAVMTLEYLGTMTHAVLTSSTDVTEYTAAYDRAVHLLAQRNAFEDLGDEDRATRRYQTAVNYLRSLPTPDDDEGNALGEGIQIPTSWEQMTEFIQ